jgi:hypothetical protein
MSTKNSSKTQVMARKKAAKSVAAEPAAPAKTGVPDGAVAPKARGRRVRERRPKKVSALDAAARLLGEAGRPMNSQEMITEMAEKGYWKSPGGKTPHATLFAAMLREIKTKGKEFRFAKAERGRFMRAPTA